MTPRAPRTPAPLPTPPPRPAAVSPRPPACDDDPGSDVVLDLLQRMQGGDDDARDQVFGLLYRELRRTAGRILRGRDRGTFQPTDLVHGAFFRLLGGPRAWESRKHFLDVAAEAMRHVLIDHHRNRQAKKRGGDLRRVGGDELDRCLRSLEDRGIVLPDLDAALRRLHDEFPEAARCANLRLFAGLDLPVVADVMGKKLRTAERTWQFARLRLRGLMSGWETEARGGGTAGPGPTAAADDAPRPAGRRARTTPPRGGRR